MRKIILSLMPVILFIACESEDDDVSIVGTWTITSFYSYEDPNCTGDFQSQIDSMEYYYGPDSEWTLEFTDNEMTQRINATMTGEHLCNLLSESAGATGSVEGNNCVLSLDGYTISLALDTLCMDFDGGAYSSGNCSITDSETIDYTVDGDEITITWHAGTDSVESQSGPWSISEDVLNMTTSGDYGCDVITATK